MKDIALFGAGGFGREEACFLRNLNEALADEGVKKHHLMPSEPWNLIGFFDDNLELKGNPGSHFGDCLGGIAVLNSWDKPIDVCIAIGVHHIVEKAEKGLEI